MDVFRKCLHVFAILHDCVDRSCVCQLSSNEYIMMMMMMMMMITTYNHVGKKFVKLWSTNKKVQ